MKNDQEEIDLYRDTYVRYLGYANEVGEAFRSLVPKSIVWSSYALSSGYVLADTIHKGVKVYQEDATPQKIKNVLLSTSDTLLWQAFASVIVPGFTINRICAAVQFAQRKNTRIAWKKPWISTLIGLISIPFIIHPIDHAVEGAMDITYRKWTGYHPKGPLCVSVFYDPHEGATTEGRERRRNISKRHQTTTKQWQMYVEGKSLSKNDTDFTCD
ncbi:PREDICTED: mitochondrial fission process protein 1 [Trachymyrmex cornetzi]|uniref:mitochondrial fission process protein 1 n=1 Tax=Trachymyrmex cornetzi TaxID=471704 RepID=UPI00084F3A5B|nr:PREDICTED: mitochondrial fission process protein 1 [Trachymyrmex cornetzi]